jgi:deoxycytidylate deaminase
MQDLLQLAYETRELFQKRSACQNVHIAILYKGKNRREYIGVNKFNATYKNPLHCFLTIHAEMDAINGLLRGYNNEKAKTFARQNMKIFVVRFTKSGLLANSRPCKHCVIKMHQLGIKKVTWTNTDRTMESDTPYNLLKNNTIIKSTGNRKLY